MFFSSDMKKLSKELHTIIKYLRNVDQFTNDRKKYNKQYRQQRYRNEKLAIEKERLNHKDR